MLRTSLYILLMLLASCSKEIKCRNTYISVFFNNVPDTFRGNVVINEYKAGAVLSSSDTFFYDDNISGYKSVTSTPKHSYSHRAAHINIGEYTGQQYKMIFINTAYRYNIDQLNITQKTDKYSRGNQGVCYNDIQSIVSDSVYTFSSNNGSHTVSFGSTEPSRR